MQSQKFGPKSPLSQEIHQLKYRLPNESFERAMTRIANHLKDSEQHFQEFRDILLDMRFLPAGRVQSSCGSPRDVTAFNCFVSGKIEDSMDSIMDKAKEAAETMRRGGGIGYDFSNLRPRDTLIGSLDSKASGPVSFMQIYDAICQTIASAGHRRGAQMGTLRVDHPDIEEFIRCKNNSGKLTGFNISIGITDAFMEALIAGEKKFPLTFEGKVYKYVDPQALWEEIMRSTWDWAEPGVLFIDQINKMNNLWYCEKIETTNPCGEQPLPPYGACLLGSFNIVKYVKNSYFDKIRLIEDIIPVVRAMDNIIDRTNYPLPEQEKEAKDKRRMGLGITGMANAGAMLGLKYGSQDYLDFMREVLTILRDTSYRTSAVLAKEKGPFPLFDPELYLQGNFIKRLPDDIKELISKYGIRNSHLTSIAPTGTISLTADNISSGIEPPFLLEYERTIQTYDGPRIEKVLDNAFRKGFKGLTANEISAGDHVKVLSTAQYYVDSAVSKTCNVGDHVTFDEFKRLYEYAWGMDCKGITTFRAAGKRYGILNAVSEPKSEESEDTFTTEAAEACFFDPETGAKTCE